jgi:hypothetical protein
MALARLAAEPISLPSKRQRTADAAGRRDPSRGELVRRGVSLCAVFAHCAQNALALGGESPGVGFAAGLALTVVLDQAGVLQAT